jgi:hypothetical protein
VARQQIFDLDSAIPQKESLYAAEFCIEKRRCPYGNALIFWHLRMA